MSLTTTIAEAMAARLTADTALADIDVIVWQQQDITAIVEQAINRSRGNGILIAFEGFETEDGSRQELLASIARRYTVSIIARRILGHRKAAKAADITETVAASLHNWEICDDVAAAAEIRITRCVLEQSDTIISYILEIEIISKLTN